MEKEHDNCSNLKVWVLVMKFVDPKEGAEAPFTEHVTTFKSDGCHTTRCVIVIGKDGEMQWKVDISLVGTSIYYIPVSYTHLDVYKRQVL